MYFNDCPAFLGTSPACVSAISAMSHMTVMAAFLSTRIAYVCAHGADLISELASGGKKLCSKKANIGTLLVQPDALRQAFYIFFLEAGYFTMCTFPGTGITRINTILIF